MVDYIVTLEDVKEYIRVFHHDDDTTIQEMLDTAHEACRAYIGAEGEVFALEALPAAIRSHVAVQYDNRESVGIPDDAFDLMREHREWVFG
ncbi:MAG: head-tail connector protein [Brevundimonas sp.]